MLNDLYPLKFIPSFHYRIWGGEKLKTKVNKDTTESNIGESWEISVVEGFESIVKDGNLKGKSLSELSSTYKEKLLGERVYKDYGDKFPLLIKFIDTNEKLSLQVHPDDDYAKKNHNSFGKTEMWYIIDSESDSKISLGFNKDINKDLFVDKVNKGEINDLINEVETSSGDAFYVPSGTIHAIGKGITLVEIQQNSDVTYRIFDYDRIDKDGKKRELHIDSAVDVIDFSKFEDLKINYKNLINQPFTIKQSKFFHTNKIILTEKIDIKLNQDSFSIFIQTKGNSQLEVNSKIYNLNLGETILIPAIISDIKIIPLDNQSELLFVSI